MNGVSRHVLNDIYLRLFNVKEKKKEGEMSDYRMDK
jgi:hypothetical protein